ncbi:MAG: hypothetical protein U0470_01200 [Anaerolineae bacterium]
MPAAAVSAAAYAGHIARPASSSGSRRSSAGSTSACGGSMPAAAHDAPIPASPRSRIVEATPRLARSQPIARLMPPMMTIMAAV